jgi:hypothetical protein
MNARVYVNLPEGKLYIYNISPPNVNSRPFDEVFEILTNDLLVIAIG